MANLLDSLSRSYVRTDPSMYNQYETQVFEEKPKRHSGIVKCPHCEYQTHRISILKRHLLVHKKPEECIMYKCTSCPYQTKYKNQLPNHIRLVHLKDEKRKKPGPSPKAKNQKTDSKEADEENSNDITLVRRSKRQKNIEDNIKPRKRRKLSESSLSEDNGGLDKNDFDSSEDQNIPNENTEEVLESDKTSGNFAKEKSPDEEIDIETEKIAETPTQKPPSWSYRCSACDFKTFKRSHVRKHTTSEKLRKSLHKTANSEVIMCCSFCKFENIDENHFKEHMKQHEKPKQTVWLCEKCSHQANSRRNLREHDIRYHRPKPEKVLTKCTFCDYRSFWRDAVKKHIDMVHKDPENILMNICDICGHQTKYKNNFKRHMATHKDLSQLSETEKFTCRICYFETHDKYTLKKHLKKQKCSPETADSMLKCPDCNFRAWNKGDITKHSIIHNKNKSVPQKMFTCHLCQYTSKWKSHVQRHIKNIHEKELEGRKRLPKNIIVETMVEPPKEETELIPVQFDPWKNTLWNVCDKPVVEPQAKRLLESQDKHIIISQDISVPIYLKPSFEEHVVRHDPVDEPLPPLVPLSSKFELNFDNLINGTDFVEPKCDDVPKEINANNEKTVDFDEFTPSPDVKDESTSSNLTPNRNMDTDDDEKEPDYIELQTPNPIFNPPEENISNIDKLDTCFADEAFNQTNDDLLEDVKSEDSKESETEETAEAESDVKEEIKEEDDGEKVEFTLRKSARLKICIKQDKTKKVYKKKTKKPSKDKENKKKESPPKKEPVSKSEIGQARFNRSFKCSLCGYQNVHRSMVARHVKVHIKHGQIDVEIIKVNGVRFNSVSNKNLMKKTYKCSACGYKHLVRTMVKRHQQTHVRKKETNLEILLLCGYCDFEHLEQYVLKKHYLLEHRILKCHVCPFETKTRKELQDHITIHRKNEELEMSCCEVCGFKTPWRDSLKKHMLIHKAPEETTWYCCEVCAFQTKHKNNLKEHLLTHKDSTEVETYRCPHCEFETKHKWRLKKHLRQKCNPEGCEMNYKCDHCNFKAYNKADVEKHAKSHVGEEIFFCNLCDYKTIVKRNFKRHVLVSHQS